MGAFGIRVWVPGAELGDATVSVLGCGDGDEVV